MYKRQVILLLNSRLCVGRSYSAVPVYYIIEKLKNDGCQIEDFVETHLFKLRGLLRSAYYGFGEEQKSDKICLTYYTV